MAPRLVCMHGIHRSVTSDSETNYSNSRHCDWQGKRVKNKGRRRRRLVIKCCLLSGSDARQQPSADVVMWAPVLQIQVTLKLAYMVDTVSDEIVRAASTCLLKMHLISKAWHLKFIEQFVFAVRRCCGAINVSLTRPCQ